MSKEQQIADILKRIEVEGMSLRKSCDVEGVPISTFMRWVSEDESLADQYARVREVGLEKMAEDILSIADDGLNDTYKDENGNTFTDNDVIQRSKLRVDARKWLLSKMLPKKYGDKLDVTSGGKEITAPIVGLRVVEKKPEE